MKKHLLIFFVLLLVGFYFAGNAQAEFPTSAGLGDDCYSSDECGSGLCSNGGICVECISAADDCDAGQTCDQGVCVDSGGNDVGDTCRFDDQCDSGNCGQNQLCLNSELPEGCFDAVGDDDEITDADCNTSQNESCPLCENGEAIPDENDGGDGTGDEDWTGIDLTIQDVFAIINGLACWFARIASVLMVIFIIIAGIRFMAARGDPKAFTAARTNFNHVLIGLLVILGVYVIIATVANAVGIKDFSFIPLVC